MKTLKLLIKTLLPALFFFLALFISAGRFDYWQGWIYIAVILCMILLSFLSKKNSTELINERVEPGAGMKRWDRLILTLSVPLYVIMLIVAGLDSGRYQWSPQIPLSIFCIGLLLVITGQLIFHIAKSQNSFFSSVVRIQTERGHVVCETGLYKVVRHPGYLGSIISTIGFPLLMCSLWSTIPAFISIVMLVIRTHFEDKTLKDELSGYLAYSLKTRNRLIPLIW